MLDKLVELSPNLTKLTLSNFGDDEECDEEYNEVIADMADKILMRPNLRLTHLDL